MRQDESMKLKIALLRMQRDNLIARYERYKKRNAFIKKNMNRILKLSTEGWPRTKNMKDYIKWIDLIYEAKISGVYSIGTSNCDVIAQLERFAKEIKSQNKKV